VHPYLKSRSIADAAARIFVVLTQYAPRREMTAGIVLTMIEMSSQIDQFSR